MKRVRRAVVAFVLGSVALFLTACGGDEDVPAAESEPTLIEPTDTAVKEETAEEFIRRWFSVTEEMQNTGKTDLYLGMASECEPCREIAKDVEDIYAAGGEVRFQGDRIQSVGPYGQGKDRYLVEAQVLPTAYETARGAPTETFPGGAERFIVTLHPEGVSWKVVDLSALADGS